jgi:hypothetical protein
VSFPGWHLINIDASLILAQMSVARRSGNAGSTRPHPYPQTHRGVRAQAPGRAQDRRVDVDLEDDLEQHQPEHEVEPAVMEPELEPEDDRDLGPELEGISALDFLELMNYTKVCVVCIGSSTMYSQSTEP